MIDADRKWMAMAQFIATTFSKDKSTQIGCVIVGQDDILRSTGYNGFIRGVDDNSTVLQARPTKYLWTVHAEVNAIVNAARMGIATRGCKLYTSMSSCSACAPIIVQAGIAEVISYSLGSKLNFKSTNPDTQTTWYNESVKALDILRIGGVTVRFFEEN